MKSNRLVSRVEELRRMRRKALVVFITAGYPTAAATERIFAAAERGGADIIELGIPFSDPVADGPTIQFSSDRALAAGMTPAGVFSLVRRIRAKSDTPIILMSYLNPLLRGGIENTARRAALSGADGFVIPDLIPEESRQVAKALSRYGLSLIFLASPNTPAARLERIGLASGPFVYIVSVAGVTGKRKALPHGFTGFMELTRRKISKPRFVGFGISGPEQARRMKRHADGVIVGSALIEIIKKSGAKAACGRITAFTRSLKNALK